MCFISFSHMCLKGWAYVLTCLFVYEWKKSSADGIWLQRIIIWIEWACARKNGVDEKNFDSVPIRMSCSIPACCGMRWEFIHVLKLRKVIRTEQILYCSAKSSNRRINPRNGITILSQIGEILLVRVRPNIKAKYLPVSIPVVTALHRKRYPGLREEEGTFIWRNSNQRLHLLRECVDVWRKSETARELLKLRRRKRRTRRWWSWRTRNKRSRWCQFSRTALARLEKNEKHVNTCY